MRLERMQPGDAGPQRDDLDEIVLAARCLHERARIGDVNAHSRMLVHPAGEVPITSTDHAHDVRLELHRVHRPGPGAERLQHRRTSPRPPSTSTFGLSTSR